MFNDLCYDDDADNIGNTEDDNDNDMVINE
jgi:hypothetical protein